MKRIVKNLILGTFLLTGVGTYPLTAQAKTIYTAPKSFRHTWYQYVGHGKYDRLRFTKHKISTRIFTEGKYYKNTYKFKLQGPSKKGYWNLHSIHQTAGAGNNYKVVYKKINGKKQPVLNTYYGYQSGIGHYYLFKTHRK